MKQKETMMIEEIRQMITDRAYLLIFSHINL
jgi:hypothetical protein